MGVAYCIECSSNACFSLFSACFCVTESRSMNLGPGSQKALEICTREMYFHLEVQLSETLPKPIRVCLNHGYEKPEKDRRNSQ